nr:hypothetical protein [Methanosphaerula palustris]
MSSLFGLAYLTGRCDLKDIPFFYTGQQFLGKENLLIFVEMN